MILEKIREGDCGSICEWNAEIRALFADDRIETLRHFFRVFIVKLAEADNEDADSNC